MVKEIQKTQLSNFSKPGEMLATGGEEGCRQKEGGARKKKRTHATGPANQLRKERTKSQRKRAREWRNARAKKTFSVETRFSDQGRKFGPQ